MGFIEEIAPLIQKHAPEYGIKVCSPIIAQAILESGMGTSNKVYSSKNGWCHNYFGLKWRDGRCAISNDYFEEWTSEQNPDGSYKQIVSKFMRFNSMEDGVIGYFQWTNIPNYSNLKGVTDARIYLELIKKDKYASSLNYVENLMKVIDKYNLTQYDKKGNYPSVGIQAFNGSRNMTSVNGRKIEYIVVHYTANTSSKPGTALSNANYFNKETTNASADYIVDDANIIQYNSNPLNQYCWSVGGKKLNANGVYHNICTNANSISVELCSNKVSAVTKNATDTDWYFTPDTLKNGIELIKFLMEFWQIDIDHVIRHHDVTGKICPNPFVVNAKAQEDWSNFKKMLEPAAADIVPEEQKYYRVQLGAYKNKANAEKLANELKEKGYSAIIKYY